MTAPVASKSSSSRCSTTTGSNSWWMTSITMAAVIGFCLVFYTALHQPTVAVDSSEQGILSSTSTASENNSNSSDFTFSTTELENMRQRLTPPRPISYEKQGNAWHMTRHQVLHLHHMKTGGTSLSQLLKCATRRLMELNVRVNETVIHECSKHHYEQCVSGHDSSCAERVQTAAVMSYCAPIHDLQHTSFGWLDSSESSSEKENKESSADNTPKSKFPFAAITVLRHPVDRVWSMYRFRTKSCYQCKTLKEVLHNLNETRAGNCRNQLLNHQTRNMMIMASRNGNSSSKFLEDDVFDIDNAIHNLQHFLVGITEQMHETVQMVGKVFPWLAETLEEQNAALLFPNGNAKTFNASTASTSTCPLLHSNASPRNNRCGKDGGHWDLPSHPPDEETIQLILQHNQYDLQLYQAAVRQFELQKRVLLENE